ncbi:ribokinase [Nocardioides albidus]|uniref:Ribokinase n=1 Tax=Nocardioides albidus TaxID=1517589 RepID=A0A5C4VLY6_9ACTN|nr:ribokinase [Nocardioides albidus]TNM36476.1 ribokinase [Nocardioides albidus]
MPGSGAVTVVGSANLDQIVRVVRLPAPGETVTTTGLREGPGGKGLNQAVAAARSGAAVTFVGAVGRDSGADLLLGHLRDNAVSTRHVARVDGPTGSAIVMVDDEGENAILVTSGANGQVPPLPDGTDEWLACDVVLLQLELPSRTVLQCAVAARSRGVRVLLNAAPAAPLPDGLLEATDLLVVNETECRTLAGVESLESAAHELARRVPVVVVTLGARGAMWFEDGRLRGELPPPAVSPVDTTGAGDAFCGALAARLAAGDTVEEAVRFALVAGALSTQGHGADTAPTLASVRSVLGVTQRGR